MATPTETQPKKTTLFLGILFGLLFGVAIGLMSPFSLQFDPRNDRRQDATNTLREKPPVPMTGFRNPITGVSEWQDSRPVIRERIRRGEELGWLIEFHIKDKADSFTIEQMLCPECQMI